MLSIINAAEVLFRHETASRSRERALIASIRERRAAETAFATATTIEVRSLAPAAPAPTRAAALPTRVTWARPIGVDECATTVCATG